MQSEREREREGGREREGEREGEASMAGIPINKVYFMSKHVKNSNQRGNQVYFVSKHVKNSNQRGVLRLQASLRKASEREREREREREGQACQEFQEFQSTRCTLSPSRFVHSE